MTNVIANNSTVNVWVSEALASTSAVFPQWAWITIAVILFLFSATCVNRLPKLFDKEAHNLDYRGARKSWYTVRFSEDTHSGWVFLWLILAVYAIYFAYIEQIDTTFVLFASIAYVIIGCVHMLIGWSRTVSMYTEKLRECLGADTFGEALKEFVFGNSSCINGTPLNVDSIMEGVKTNGVFGAKATQGEEQFKIELDNITEEEFIPVMDAIESRLLVAREAIIRWVGDMTKLDRNKFDFIPQLAYNPKPMDLQREYLIEFDFHKQRVTYWGPTDTKVRAREGITRHNMGLPIGLGVHPSDLDYLKQNMAIEARDHKAYITNLFLAWPAYAIKFVVNDLFDFIGRTLSNVFGSVFKRISNRTRESV